MFGYFFEGSFSEKDDLWYRMEALVRGWGVYEIMLRLVGGDSIEDKTLIQCSGLSGTFCGCIHNNRH